ncbi:MAG: pentapeptide repeat-containing protein [Microcoleus sp.]
MITKATTDWVIEQLNDDDLSWFAMNKWGNKVAPETLKTCGTTHCLFGSAATKEGVHPDFNRAIRGVDYEFRCFHDLMERLFFMGGLTAAQVQLLYRSMSADGSFFDLSGANLRDADLTGANLRGADLSGADLSGADLSDADLSGANLSGANLSDANLRGADLICANLSGADLSGANLRDANLSGANLRGADLICADLIGADLRGAIAVWNTNA